jgi:hypothetical protein
LKKTPQGRGRLVAEFFLIVIGVLAALAADTAFENRRDNEFKDEYLARLESDLQSDVTDINYRIAFFNDVQAYSGDMLNWLSSDAPVDQDVLLAAFYAAEVWPFLPNRSTFEDLQSTGNIRLLDDIELRTSLSRYYNRADTSRSGWNPAEDYREVIRGIIPNDVQGLIRQNCPTTDTMDEQPTGFPDCELPGVDYEKLTRLFARLKDDVELREILTYRHSELGVMNYLLAQQHKFGEQVLEVIAAQ